MKIVKNGLNQPRKKITSIRGGKKMLKDVKNIDTDVLIIGGGGAALRAAIEAIKTQTDVLVVSKTALGRDNSTQIAGGFFRAAMDNSGKEQHIKDTLEGGKNLSNQELVNILVDEAPIRIKELENFGLQFMNVPGGIWCQRGSLSDLLTQIALERGIQVNTPVMITNLFKTADGFIGGALGFNFTTGDILVYRAKSIILATGGSGQIFKWNDNPPRTTGDGYILAYQVGATLQDMEFFQVYPIGTIESGTANTPLFPDLFLQGNLKDSKGDDFLKEDLRQIDVMKERDILARLIGLELYKKQLHEGLLLDLSDLADEIDLYQKVGIKDFDYKNRMLRVAPLAHFLMGGVTINGKCETNIPGLFAAGEVSCGLHGTNRVAGNALSEIIVFGTRAGKFASEYTKSISFPNLDGYDVNLQVESLKKFDKQMRTGNKLPHHIKENIKETNHDNGAWIVRSKQSLMQTLSELQTIRTDLPTNLFADNLHSLMECKEIFNMIDISELIMKSALKREESRGAHYRVDLPDTKEDWLKNIVHQIKV